MREELVKRLRENNPDKPTTDRFAAADLIEQQAARIAALEERLEMNRAFVLGEDGETMVRIEVESGSIPDGIDCRDETIKLLDNEIARCHARIAKLEEEARHMVPIHDDGRFVFIDGAGDVELDHGGKMSARIAALEAALRWYADQCCELHRSHECCGKLTDEECAGCRARALLGDTNVE